MPLFMDRHDVPGVTAEQVAQAHLADLDMGVKFGVQFLAYWFDADQGEAFCLAKAPTGDSLTAVHKATHGLIPNEIISVSEDNVLRLLGRMSETGGHTEEVTRSGRSCSRICRARRRSCSRLGSPRSWSFSRSTT